MTLARRARTGQEPSTGLRLRRPAEQARLIKRLRALTLIGDDLWKTSLNNTKFIAKIIFLDFVALICTIEVVASRLVA
jgi:hypothetical protein